VGVLNPGAVFPKTGVAAFYTTAATEKMAADLDALVARGVITYQLVDETNPTPAIAAVQANEVLTAVLTVSNAQAKALKATGLTLVPAPGAGRILVPIEATVYLKYGGTNAFTAPASESLVVKRVGGANLLIGGAQAFLQATASSANRMTSANAAQASVTDSKTLSDNVALQFINVGAAEIAGNAGADNTLVVVASYRIDQISW
jgi:hypothetical protein